MTTLQSTISFLFQILTILVFVDAIISFFLPYDNQFRIILDKIVQPMLRPIQRIVPPMGNFDFSPIILLIIIQVVESIIIRLI